MSSLPIPQDIELTSACYARTPVTGTHTLSELPLCGKLNLRADSSNNAIVQSIGKALSVLPPVEANTTSSTEQLTVFWAGPDEWLVHCPLDQTGTVAEQLRGALGTHHHAITDVSDYYAVLQLSGPQSAELLQRGCPMDLHPSAFTAGSIAQSRFGHASVLLQRHGDMATWDIQVRWTYAEYVWDYLESAMAAL